MSREAGAAATIEDVASSAGVSVATVSRALRGLPNVAPSTRDKVLKVAAELHYVANPTAARLAGGRTGTVAVAVPMFDSWYFAKVVAGIEAILKAASVDRPRPGCWITNATTSTHQHAVGVSGYRTGRARGGPGRPACCLSASSG